MKFYRRLRTALYCRRNAIRAEILYAILKIENTYNCLYRKDKGQVLTLLRTECLHEADKMSMRVY